MIRTAESIVRARPGDRDVAVEYAARAWTSAHPDRPFAAPLTVSSDTPAVAFVQHGRWIVRCPFCPSAADAARTDPRFFCVECENAEVNGQWVPVVWPRDVDTIESVLARRAKDTHRNWMPHESVADLRRENTTHGVK